ncbi:MAG: hypothetical protein ACI9SP_002058 [Arenicella sp.]|jgi:hypothetical protein
MPDKKIPPPPEKPSANECCGGGCVPCIYDYYYDALDKWHLQYGETLAKKAPLEQDKIND